MTRCGITYLANLMLSVWDIPKHFLNYTCSIDLHLVLWWPWKGRVYRMIGVGLWSCRSNIMDLELPIVILKGIHGTLSALQWWPLTNLMKDDGSEREKGAMGKVCLKHSLRLKIFHLLHQALPSCERSFENCTALDSSEHCTVLPLKLGLRKVLRCTSEWDCCSVVASIDGRNYLVIDTTIYSTDLSCLFGIPQLQPFFLLTFSKFCR